jgi:hypothetical protein
MHILCKTFEKRSGRRPESAVPDQSILEIHPDYPAPALRPSLQKLPLRRRENLFIDRAISFSYFLPRKERKSGFGETMSAVVEAE